MSYDITVAAYAFSITARYSSYSSDANPSSLGADSY